MKLASIAETQRSLFKPFSKFVRDVSPYIDHKNRLWLQTEYDTAVLRAHQAAQWQQFIDERDVFPNLKWMESTSPTPGEDHKVFWNTVRPVNDPFWDVHRPGDRWNFAANRAQKSSLFCRGAAQNQLKVNCKCSLEQSDDPVTPVPDSSSKDKPSPGLENNPAKDKQLFSDKHPYFPDNCSSCQLSKNKLFALIHNLSGDKNCTACRYLAECIQSSTIDTHDVKVIIRDFVSDFPLEKFSGNISHQLRLTTENGDELPFRKSFFEEVKAKCIRKNNYGKTMKIAFKVREWAESLQYVRTESGIHCSEDFRVYTTNFGDVTIELKVKVLSDILLPYTMRLI